MKCPSCSKGTIQIRNDSIEQDDVEFESYQCANCGEEILTMQQVKVLANKYASMRNK